MNIREIQEKDKEAVLEMMKVFYHSPAVIEKSPEEVLRRDIEHCLSDMPYIEGLVLEEDEKIIGYAMIAKSYSTEFGGLCIWLEDLYVCPEYQGQGRANEVFKYVEEKYKNQMVRMRLEVSKGNSHAVKSYHKNGFKELHYMAMTKEFKK